MQIRNVRREANDQLKKAEKDGDITEDELRTAQDSVQQTTDRFTDEIEELSKTKEEEILEV